MGADEEGRGADERHGQADAEAGSVAGAVLSAPPLHVQDGLFGNSCFGCGAWNQQGLRIKSSWEGEVSVCEFTPSSHHAAMPHDIVNGGIIAAVIDCHSVCTAIADAYRRAGRYPGDGEQPLLWYATASLKVEYRKPTSIAGAFRVETRVVGVRGRGTKLATRLVDCRGEETCVAEVLAVETPDVWARAEGLFG